jgi:hypothetical protein
MQEIKCPNCGKTFSIYEAGYANILSQVRDEAFDKELNERLALAENDKKTLLNSRNLRLLAKWRRKPLRRIERSNA